VTELPHVEFRNVDKSYDGKVLVLEDFNLSIRKGEFLTLLGASGSGKSTCLMLLAGFEYPTGGQIFLQGNSIRQLPPYRRNFGVVFQNYSIFPHMTVGDNIAYPLKARGLSRAEIKERVVRALDMVKLTGFAERQPAMLSGGQQQRVALARAMSFDPTLILMDEPLGALDRQLREEMQYEIKRLHARLGVTIVYVTHDQDEALVMSDRVAVLSAGIIRQIDVPRRIYDHPTSLFVAKFIGENNSIPCTVAGIEGDRCIARTANGTELKAMRAVTLEQHAPTQVCIRPENIRVLTDRGGAENVVDSVIRQVIFHGDHVRFAVETLGIRDIVVKIPRRDLGSGEYSPGSKLLLGWNAADCVALDSPAAPSPVASPKKPTPRTTDPRATTP
jgi:putative spermidine/putrescine transport system ATP-binding protein